MIRAIVGRALLILCGLYAVNVFAYGEVDSNAVDVSVISLIANPEQYHGKKVRVIGAVNIGFEGQHICLSEDDLKQRLMQQCIHMNFDHKALGTDIETLKKYNLNYVLLEGFFSMKSYPSDQLKSDHSGKLRITVGHRVHEIKSISRYQLWNK